MMQTTRRLVNAAVFVAALIGMFAATSGIGDCQTTSKEKERELIAVLSSNAPAAEKAITCKQLAIDGSSQAVPELARLLNDEHLASWARIALEVIPGSAADEALRKATTSLQGRLLIGTINSIGVRRDAGAVDLLSGRLQDQDVDVASAAAIALGRVGNSAAAQALRPALATAPVKVRSAVAEGCVLCAERFLAEGNSAEAAKIYDEVRKADVPRQRVIEATRGAILARKQEGIPLLIELIGSPDKGLFQIALSTAREIPGPEIGQALAEVLDRTSPDRAALVINIIADRKETVVLEAVLKAATRGPKQVRMAALTALGRVGDATCLSQLLDNALESDAELVQAAKTALASLPDENVDKEIIARLAKADGKVYPLLIELVGQRRIEATAELVKALAHSDESVRSAALTSLGNTVPAKSLGVLISSVVDPQHASDATVAAQALKAASIRMPDREACATELASAMERAAAPTKVVLLEILGAVGGTKALQTLAAAAKSSDPQLQDASSRLLGEWMTIDAAPVLLDLAAPGEKYQVRALRGYIRIARQFVMPESQRVEMCKNALQASRQPAEQKLVLEVLKRYPNLDMLKLAINAMQIPDLTEEAGQAARAIAPKLISDAKVAKEARELMTKAGLE